MFKSVFLDNWWFSIILDKFPSYNIFVSISMFSMLDFQSKVIKNFITSQLPDIKQQYRVFCSQMKPSLKTVKKKKSPVSSLKTPKWKKEKILTLDALMRFSLKIMHIQ